MAAADLPSAAALEAAAGDAPWSSVQLAAELAKPLARYYVAATAAGPAVVGYIGGWIIAPELQLANVVIHPDFRRRGIGRWLLATLLARAKQEGCAHSTLEVRRGNAPAQALYRAAGYYATGVRPRMYTAPVEDAILMEKPL